LKGFTRDGKFHPITDYKKGFRKSRDQTAKTQGVRIRKEIASHELDEQLVQNLIQFYSEDEHPKNQQSRYTKMHKDFEAVMKLASLTEDQAVELVKKTQKPLMFYIQPKEGNYFPIEKLRFNDRTSVKNIWLLGDYDDKHGDYLSSFIIKDDKDWNRLVDEGMFIGYRKDGTINTDFKTRDRSKDKK